MEITKVEELASIQGGAIASSVINSINKMVSTLFSLGQAFGSALRRTYTKRYC